MPEYKITRISQDPPREWQNPKGGVVYYRKVMLEGWDKPVSLGKKSPDALSVGMTVYGTVERTPQSEDKFHAEQNPNFAGGGQGSSKPPYVPKDEAAIKAMWSIGQAVTLLKAEKVPNNAAIELWADTFFEMVDRVKQGNKPDDKELTVVPLEEPMTRVHDNNPMKPDPIIEDFGEPINLDEIPF